MVQVTRQGKRESFADMLDDNLTQILLVVEKMKLAAWKSNDAESLKELSIISSRISRLYDARLELAENLVTLQN